MVSHWKKFSPASQTTAEKLIFHWISQTALKYKIMKNKNIWYPFFLSLISIVACAWCVLPVFLLPHYVLSKISPSSMPLSLNISPPLTVLVQCSIDQLDLFWFLSFACVSQPQFFLLAPSPQKLIQQARSFWRAGEGKREDELLLQLESFTSDTDVKKKNPPHSFETEAQLQFGIVSILINLSN